jgi:hypothetical protein
VFFTKQLSVCSDTIDHNHNNQTNQLHTQQQNTTQKSREKWMNRWAAGKNGRVVYNYMNKPNKNDDVFT